MKHFSKKLSPAWWLFGVALFLLSACGGDTDDLVEPTQFEAALTGAQEVPPVLTSARGTGLVTVDPDTRAMTAVVNTVGITGTAAHIHEAPRGLDGPIIFPLTQTAPGSGVWTTSVLLSDAQLATLRAGNYYFNVHSFAFPDGEIRGQIGGEGSDTMGGLGFEDFDRTTDFDTTTTTIIGFPPPPQPFGVVTPGPITIPATPDSVPVPQVGIPFFE